SAAESFHQEKYITAGSHAVVKFETLKSEATVPVTVNVILRDSSHRIGLEALRWAVLLVLEGNSKNSGFGRLSRAVMDISLLSTACSPTGDVRTCTLTMPAPLGD